MSKEELLASIRPDMKHLTKDIFKRVYGYEISYPGFSGQAIAALDAVGCTKARQYYEDWVRDYEAAYRAKIKSVAAWYAAECEKKWEKRQKEGEERRRQEEADSTSIVQSNYLQQQKEKLTELKQRLHALN